MGSQSKLFFSPSIQSRSQILKFLENKKNLQKVLWTRSKIVLLQHSIVAVHLNAAWWCAQKKLAGWAPWGRDAAQPSVGSDSLQKPSWVVREGSSSSSFCIPSLEWKQFENRGWRESSAAAEPGAHSRTERYLLIKRERKYQMWCLLIRITKDTLKIYSLGNFSSGWTSSHLNAIILNKVLDVYSGLQPCSWPRCSETCSEFTLHPFSTHWYADFSQKQYSVALLRLGNPMEVQQQCFPAFISWALHTAGSGILPELHGWGMCYNFCKAPWMYTKHVK